MGKRGRREFLNSFWVDMQARNQHTEDKIMYNEGLLRSFFTTLLNNQETIISRLKGIEYDIARLRGEVSYLHEEKQEREVESGGQED